MAGSLTVYSLGDHGVNVSVDPLHTDIGDVTVAQNARFYGSGQRGGLSKRGGLRILATGLDGAVLAMISVDLTDPTGGALLTDNDLNTLTDMVFLVLTE